MKVVFIVIFSVVTTLNVHAYTKGKTYKLTILHTNDHHGRFWSNKDGEVGLAARATLINNIRSEVKNHGGNVLLLDAGDVNTGIPQSDLQKAEPDFKGMGAIGYDVMALGNHEFDQPLNVILQQRDWANFPFVSANIYSKKSKERIFPASVDKNFDDLKVTVFGLTTEDTPLKAKPGNTNGIFFTPSVEEASKLVPTLRPKTDILIALTHIGHYPNEQHGADAPGDVTLARKVNGIDIIVGGHTQKPLFEPDIQNKTIIVQAYEWGKYVGRIDLEFLDGKLTMKSYKLIPVNLKDSKEKIKQDEKILAILKPFKEKGDKSLLTVIGSADEEFSGKREQVRMQETSLGNLVAKAFKDKFNADIGLCNSGGIRESLYPGKITMESVMTVLPFGGEIVTSQMNGQELTNYLEYIVLNLTPGSGSFPQISGVELTVDRVAKKVSDIKVNGKNISLTQKYVLALPEFIANGGDKYPKIAYTKYGSTDGTVFGEYVSKIKKLRTKSFAPTGYIKTK